MENRAQEAETIVNWAFRQFVMKKFGKSGFEIAKAKVWNGKSKTVGLNLERDLDVMVPVLSSSEPSFAVEYLGPIKAPINKGDRIAELVIKLQGLPETRHNLLAANSVTAGGFFVQIRTAAEYLFSRLFKNSEESL